MPETSIKQPISRKQYFLRLLFVLILLQWLALEVYAWLAKGRSSEETLSVGSAAPNVSLGEEMLSSYRGMPVLLHFWATWCAPCRRELPSLLSMAAENRDALHVFAITEEEQATVESFFQKQIPTEVRYDRGGDANLQYRIDLLPTSYLVNAEGKIVQIFRGPQDWQALQSSILRP